MAGLSGANLVSKGASASVWSASIDTQSIKAHRMGNICRGSINHYRGNRRERKRRRSEILAPASADKTFWADLCISFAYRSIRHDHDLAVSRPGLPVTLICVLRSKRCCLLKCCRSSLSTTMRPAAGEAHYQYRVWIYCSVYLANGVRHFRVAMDRQLEHILVHALVPYCVVERPTAQQLATSKFARKVFT